jgi:hypothetical protein
MDSDKDLSIELTALMPVVAHKAVIGVNCPGSIVAAAGGSNVELQCNECGAVMGVVQIDILSGLIGLDG